VVTYLAHSITTADLGASLEGVDFRQTPVGQPTVEDLLRPGTIIKTNYGTGPYVVRSVSQDDWNDLCYWTLALSEPTSTKISSWINDLVAIDGRILKLFTTSTDEINIIDHSELEQPVVAPDGQMALIL